MRKLDPKLGSPAEFSLTGRDSGESRTSESSSRVIGDTGFFPFTLPVLKYILAYSTSVAYGSGGPVRRGVLVFGDHSAGYGGIETRDACISGASRRNRKPADDDGDLQKERNSMVYA